MSKYLTHDVVLYQATSAQLISSLDKMAAISQTTFLNGFSWIKMYAFR